MFKTIKIEEILSYPEEIFTSNQIIDDKYLSQMVLDVNKLAPIGVIQLSKDLYSLSDGRHRLSVFKHLNYKKIRCEVY